MNEKYDTVLTDRAPISVTGPEAHSFLQGLLTNDIKALRAGEALFAALLSPQGKILFDMLISLTDGGLILDCRADQIKTLIKQLENYKLHAKVTIKNLSDTHRIVALYHSIPENSTHFHQDPRMGATVWRAVFPFLLSSDMRGGSHISELEDYHACRIAHAVPEGGLDFTFGQTFPHEANMDRLGGLSFSKGCYVGQEVVSRMHNRTTVRKRIVPIRWDGKKPSTGDEIKMGTRVIGTIGSLASDNSGLAMLRLDHALLAIEKNLPLIAGSSIIKPELRQQASLQKLSPAPYSDEKYRTAERKI
ncbi:MAG: folate-binding protein [Alphaproteobacteria bacterium]|nr:folate-binding protein [Alphaproteobacteria bacterium]